MRATTVLKAGDLAYAVNKANQFHPLWRAEHFANGEHNSALVPVTVIEVDSAGAVVVQTSIKAAGATYSATSSKLATGRYLITLDAAIAIQKVSTGAINTAACKAEVDLISANTVQVRTYTTNSSGTFSAADMGFHCDIYAAKFEDTVPAALTTAFAPGDFPDSTRVGEIITAQNDTHDLMLARHGFEGVHTDRRNPMAIGRITYSGGVYTVATGSIGITSASRPGAGQCALEFAVTAPTHWLVRVTPLGVASYPYTSARSTTGATVELFSTATKPVYALADGAFFVAGWAL